MRIMLLGFEFESSNYGCEALSYSLIDKLQSIFANEDMEIINVNIHESLGDFPEKYKNIRFRNLCIGIKNRFFWKSFKKELKSSNVVLDITHGDSFSDIYGKKWFITTCLVKLFVLLNKKPLILMPQTYGPYNHFWSKLLAKYIIKRSFKIYTRDSISLNYLKSIGIKKEIQNTLDLAFLLPYERPDLEKNGLKRIGINISGLLWNNCENGNPMKLKLNYIEYCKELLSYVTKINNYSVFLIPHVLCDSREGLNYYENDSRAIREILKTFPNCVFPNDFKNAINAKSFISSLDFLIAPRMHATIAAFSSHVPVLPVAYSRKFQGVFSDLKYNHLIDAKTMDVKEALDVTISSLSNIGALKADEDYGLSVINAASNAFSNDLEFVINCFLQKQIKKDNESE